MSSGDTSVVDTSLNGGWDISFDLPYLSVGEYIDVTSNVAVVPYDLTGSRVRFERNSQHDFSIKIFNRTLTKMVEGYVLDIPHPSKARITFHDCFCTVMLDEWWAHTFSLPYIKYPAVLTSGDSAGAMQLYVSGTAGKIITNIKITELYDWREAIWVDMETTSMNAIQSVIQERPVEILGSWDGAIRFYYTPMPEKMVPLPVLFVRDHEMDISDNADLASDAIVQYLWMVVTNNKDVVKEHGFITRLWRMSNLTTGAKKAAQVKIRKARQQARMHQGTLRFYPHLEVGDVVQLKYLLPGSRAEQSINVIIESLSLNAGSQSSMQIQGRELL